jgi:uncharacterized protein (TIRG00374 family)
LLRKLIKKRALILLTVLFTFNYIGILVSKENSLNSIIYFDYRFFLYILSLVFLSWFIRYVRWYTLLVYLEKKTPFFKGFVCYLSGFAFTASPGKVGELSRVILYKKLSVSPQNVVTCFFTERLIDLLVVLLLSSGVFLTSREFVLIPLLIIGLVVSIVLVIYNETVWKISTKLLSTVKYRKMFMLIDFISSVRSEIKLISRHSLLCYSALLGAISWSLIAFAFFEACHLFSIEINHAFIFGIYPLAMLIGALSFIPGGIGSTEAAIVYMLVGQSYTLATAVSIAVFIRLCTLWCAIWVGLICLIAGNFYFNRINVNSQSVRVKLNDDI